MHRGMSIAKRLATDVLSVAGFGIGLFVLATAITEQRWLLAGGAIVALLLGMRLSTRVCTSAAR